MSQWAKVKVQITNVELFKRLCEKHQLSYLPNENRSYRMQDMLVTATLQDRVGHSVAYLCAKENHHLLVYDQDPNYSSIAKRIGVGGGRLMRDYTQETLSGAIRKRGGTINWTKEQNDGSLLLKVTVS